ncbi:hypothetical protein BB561_001315 [Smittium simulii]|uniref:NADH dehydrogenase [ubiquinone] 1 alpha subcomplex subunit 13 n=1 Tax=Smittium simulii TaxID=133385 RepID=A0A2T9YV68_9FUNG|nr:hypothetical protein BB561_001315 [Smittium simulii]
MSTAQDMPRPGGFPKIQYRRSLPNKGPSGAVILGALGAVMTYGWYHVYLGIQEQRELKREKTYGRIYLLPMLTAETHRDEYRRHLANAEREKAIMKNVGDWTLNKSVYSVDRHVPPSIPNIPEGQLED